MRLLHTSDWHIGRTFHGHSTLTALSGVLDELAAAVARERVDVVLVAGDVFDSATPSAAAFRVYEQAVLAIRAAGAAVVMTSGNHDSPARLGHQSPFAAAGGVHVRTAADRAAEPVELTDEHGAVDVFALPYLEPMMVGGRTHAEVLRGAMDEVRGRIADRGNRAIVLSHCFASAGLRLETAGGERDITSGGLDVVPAEVFAGTAEAPIAYAALGHVHSRARLTDVVRYSGAPLHYSFGETSPERGGWLVDVGPDGAATVDWLPLPVPRPLARLRGRLRDLLDDPAHEAVEQHWVQVVLTDPARQQDAMARLRARFPHVAHLEHRPEGAPTADARSYGERTAGLADADLIAGFLEMVRAGDGPTDDESRLVAEVLDRLAAAERAA